MRNNSEQTAVPNDSALGSTSLSTTRAGVLGTFLSLALLLNAGNALGSTLPGPGNVLLAWDSSSSPGIAGYRVYFGAASGTYTSSVVAGNATTNTVQGLAPGALCFFAVKAYDTNGLESMFSNEVSFTPGLPTIQIRITATGHAVLTLNGLPGRMYDIQATPDFSTWNNLGTVTLDAVGSADFTDTNAANLPKRFYRSLQKP